MFLETSENVCVVLNGTYNKSNNNDGNNNISNCVITLPHQICILFENSKYIVFKQVSSINLDDNSNIYYSYTKRQQ